MSSTNPSLMIQQDEEDEDFYHHHRQQQQNHQLHSMSRLSLCTQDPDHVTGTGSHVSLMSVENFDADEEVSDGDARKGYFQGRGLLSSDSEKESGCYSLPATPPRRRRRTVSAKLVASKDYASENESGAGRSRVRRRRRSAWPPAQFGGGAGLTSSAGESDHGGVMVITRPKGGNRSLCMGLEEVKACNELGFELEHEHIMPRLSVIPAGGGGGAVDFETSSGNNSPIANWRISSPGDDPRDVKARLKVWAQAVAIASTSRQGTLY